MLDKFIHMVTNADLTSGVGGLHEGGDMLYVRAVRVPLDGCSRLEQLLLWALGFVFQSFPPSMRVLCEGKHV